MSGQFYAPTASPLKKKKNKPLVPTEKKAALAPVLVMDGLQEILSLLEVKPCIHSCSANSTVIMFILLSWLHTDYLHFRKDSAHCVKWGLHCGTTRVHITHHIMLSAPPGLPRRCLHLVVVGRARVTL